MNPFNFSNRFSEIGLGEEENLLTRIKKNKLKSGYSILDLINSNPTTAGLLFPSQIISHNITESTFSKYDPNPKGNKFAREAIANYYNSKSFQVDVDNLILTASTSESYSYLFKLLTNPGDDILIPSPGYPLFHLLSEFENLNAIEYDLKETEKGRWDYSLENVKKKITPKTKLIILVSPSNPTGSYLTKNQWDEWLQWSNLSQIPIILDEVFSPYLQQDREYHFPSSSDAPLFILNGISKLLALPQLKLGWIHINGDPDFKSKAISGLEFLADTFLSVNEPVQILLPELLKWSTMIQSQIKNRILRNHSIAESVFSENQEIGWYDGINGWYGILELESIKFQNSENLAERILQEKNILIHPGSWYGFQPERLILILSLIVPEDQFLVGIKELTSFLR